MIRINPVYINRFKMISQGYRYYDDSIKGAVLYFNKNLEYTSYVSYNNYTNDYKVSKCIERLLSLGFLELIEGE